MNERLRTYLIGLVGFVVIALVVVLPTFAGSPRVPDVGELEIVYARDAVVVETHELSLGSTFGQILTDAGLDGNADRSGTA